MKATDNVFSSLLSLEGASVLEILDKYGTLQSD